MTSDRERYNPGDIVATTCTVCSSTAVGTQQVARAHGWRIGPDVAYCPGCCGEGGVTEKGEPAGFHATCDTCGEISDDDEDDEDPWTKADAERWGQYHECEKDIVIIEPRRAAVA